MQLIRARGLELSALVVSVLVIGFVGFVTFWESHKMVSELEFSISFGIILSITLWTLGLTLLTEPGFMPTMDEVEAVHKDPQAMDRNKLTVSALNDVYWHYYSPEKSNKPPTENYLLYLHANRPAAIAFRECYSCELFKPTRSTNHCGERSCGRCVVGKDHHCLFLATCIGTRNRGNFVAFLISATSSLVLSIVIIVSDCVGYVIKDLVPRLRAEAIAAGEPKVGAVDLGYVEGSLILVFCVFTLLKLFVFPIVFSYKANQNILIVLLLFGLATILLIVIKGHAPVMPALVGYAEICLAIFIGTSLLYQIGLLRKGSTVRQLVRQEMGGERPDSPLLTSGSSDALDRFDEDDAMTVFQILEFAAKGFWFTSVPSLLLDIDLKKADQSDEEEEEEAPSSPQDIETADTTN